MSARRTAAAGDDSCHRDVGVGTLRPDDRTPRGHRALIVSNQFPSRSPIASPDERAARHLSRPLLGGASCARGLRRSRVAPRSVYRARRCTLDTLFSPTVFPPVLHARGEINPGAPARRIDSTCPASRVVDHRGSRHFPAGRKGMEEFGERTGLLFPRQKVAA